MKSFARASLPRPYLARWPRSPRAQPLLRRLSVLLSLLGLAGNLVAETPAGELGRPDLSPEEFRKRVTAQYGVLPDREPPLDVGEIALLERLEPMIRSEPQMVISALTTLQIDGRPISATFEQIVGGIYVSLGEWQQAEEAYLRAIRKFPHFQRAWNSLGSMQMEQERYADAIPSLSRSIELGASDANTYGMLGYALLRERKYIAAEVAYDAALLREPDNLRWLEGKVRIIAESGRHAEAVAAVDELQKRNPTHLEYWRLQSNAYVAMQDLPSAARSLEIARALGSVDADTLYLLGSLYLKQDMPALAFSAYLEAMERQPASSPTLVVGVGRTLLARSRFDLAERLMSAAQSRIETWPPGAQLDRHLIMGQLAEHRGDGAAAGQEYEHALVISPLNVEALFRAARVLSQHEQVARAEFYLEKIKGDPTFEYAAQLYLARLRIEAGRYEAALDPLRKAIRLRPSGEAENLYNRVRVALASSQTST